MPKRTKVARVVPNLAPFGITRAPWGKIWTVEPPSSVLSLLPPPSPKPPDGEATWASGFSPVRQWLHRWTGRWKTSLTEETSLFPFLFTAPINNSICKMLPEALKEAAAWPFGQSRVGKRQSFFPKGRLEINSWSLGNAYWSQDLKTKPCWLVYVIFLFNVRVGLTEKNETECALTAYLWEVIRVNMVCLNVCVFIMQENVFV